MGAIEESEGMAQVQSEDEERPSGDGQPPGGAEVPPESDDPSSGSAAEEESTGDQWSDEESDDDAMYLSGEEDSLEAKDPRVKVLSVLELEDLFMTAAPDLSSEQFSLLPDSKPNSLTNSIHRLFWKSPI